MPSSNQRRTFDFLYIEVNAGKCSIPDDHIDPRRTAFFMARSVLGDSDQNLPLENLNIDLPLIALVGSEAPSRLQSILAKKAASTIFKPIRSAGIYGSIVFAMNQFDERRAVQAQQKRLSDTIRYRKVVIFAMLKLMRSQSCTENHAFSILRKQAMERGITIEALCAEIAAL